jgi:hypothetical protein
LLTQRKKTTTNLLIFPMFLFPSTPNRLMNTTWKLVFNPTNCMKFTGIPFRSISFHFPFLSSTSNWKIATKGILKRGSVRLVVRAKCGVPQKTFYLK